MDETVIEFPKHKVRGNLPVIRIEPEAYADLAEAAERALLLSGLPLYRRGNRLVTPDIRRVDGADGLQTMTAVLAEVGLPFLREFMNRSARFERHSARNKKFVATDPPKETAELILARSPQWQFPEIAGILTAPTLGADGAVLDQPGFDPKSRLYFAELPTLPFGADAPGKDVAEAALADLVALLAEFPLVDNVSRAVALSAMITSVCRGAIPMAPMHAMSAPEPGSGKSYLFDICAAIATGKPCPVISPGRNGDETEKRLGAVVLAGQPVVSLDNVVGLLSSPLLCQVLERPRVLIRPLGSSTVGETETRTSWFATGINLTVADDLNRRTLIGRLDSDMERPELRIFRGDPVTTVLRERGRYIAACLTIPRAYITAGKPGRLPKLASFGQWSDLVRSALVWLGCADPVDSILMARDNDPTLQQRTAFFAAWPATDQGYTVAELIRLADATDGDYGKTEAGIALHEALFAIAPGSKGAVDPTALGKWLGANKERIVGRRKLTRATAHGGVYRWWVGEQD
ncbi:hypothetical protein [Mesorhizobium sp.]|uniref:hypothetical protein n=1 Tax=Mesorhizobium sp. TaxID=1871066 RepID=UPI000FE609C6|nr:hypothetical protein [Mesorhizobium sp.]RWO55391.1 MAG: hypothetical protein EOS14_30100 [Mesorhizobium sp.]